MIKYIISANRFKYPENTLRGVKKQTNTNLPIFYLSETHLKQTDKEKGKIKNSGMGLGVEAGQGRYWIAYIV